MAKYKPDPSEESSIEWVMRQFWRISTELTALADSIALGSEGRITVEELTGSVKIDGHPAVRMVYISQGVNTDSKTLLTWAKIDRTVYQITYTALASHYKNYIEKVEAMIDSFKILKEF